VTGAQASGKSTVADLLARRFTSAVHVRGGTFYRWAVSGWRHFDDLDHAEARRLLELRYELSAMVARRYAEAGFTAVAQDNIYGHDVVRWLERVDWSPRYLVVLRPTIETLERREAARSQATGKVAYTDAFTPAINDAHVNECDPSVGLWLDTTAQSPEATVAQILDRASEALVDP